MAALTFERFCEIAKIIEDAGQRVTGDRVASYCEGRPSDSTLSKFLRQWRELNQTQPAAAPVGDLAMEIQRRTDAVVEAKLQEQAERHAAEVSALKQQLRDMAAELERMSAARTEIESARDVEAAGRKQALAQRDELAGKLADVERDLAGATATNGALQKQVQAQLQTIERMIAAGIEQSQKHLEALETSMQLHSQQVAGYSATIARLEAVLAERGALESLSTSVMSGLHKLAESQDRAISVLGKQLFARLPPATPVPPVLRRSRHV